MLEDMNSSLVDHASLDTFKQDMLNVAMTPVLLSGGSGTRLWPKSRLQWPKQFCEIFDQSLQDLSLSRVSVFGIPWIVTSKTLKVITEKKISTHENIKIQKSRILYEPMAKNTAAAIGLTCKVLMNEGRGEEIVGIFPSDHLVRDENLFKSLIEQAAQHARHGQIVTIGIKPTHPETGYGYIFSHQGKVESFFEKPSLDKAEEFFQSGNYFWNAGIFIFKAKIMFDLLLLHEPAVAEPLVGLKSDLSNLQEVYTKIKSISIDYAVMEKLGGTGQLLCLPADFGWNDVGSWDAVVDELSGPQKADMLGRQYSVESENNLAILEDKKIAAFVGVSDLIVVDTPDALLISKRGQTQKVKTIAEKLVQAEHVAALAHQFEIRPWGRYEILCDDKNYKSKIISIDPGQQISYQSHQHRQEHWVITAGEGIVTIDEAKKPVKVGDHVLIPMQAKHSIHNPTNFLLQFIEVQTGSYFGEDDIVRYSDIYGRA
jgi:mannose-1-phosphate guanylyltransferase/mannose-6-phosphate isomerase